jgi:hypothetical protein
MKRKSINKKAGIFIVLISIMLITPTLTAIGFQKKTVSIDNFEIIIENEKSIDIDITKNIDQLRYVPMEEISMAPDHNDIGYNVDAGRDFRRATPVYVGEPVDIKPGNGRTGYLYPNQGDEVDCYSFYVCEGQSISASLSTSEDYYYDLLDHDTNPVSNGYVAVESKRHFFQVTANEGADDGEYTFDITLSGQNDAGTGNDAGDSISQATAISPGEYTAYMDYNDQEDWYSINVNSGQGIFVRVDALERSDYDIHLYNPNNELVHEEQFYGEDELEYPADATGLWKIQIDMFPGWDASLWPDNYHLYGSGVYELDVTIGGDAEAPPALESQPNIVPVAQTFIVNDDPTGVKDEYGYIAAIPAANYYENGQRFLSPIVYQGVDIIPNWFTSIDDTTQYLIDDWNTYLDRHDVVAEEIILNPDPIQAAATIATSKWTSSNTAVVAVDGSGFEDEIIDLIDTDTSLTCTQEVTSYQPDELQELVPDSFSAPMYIGAKWGAIHVIGEGANFAGDTIILTPRYETLMGDWWPHDSSANGPDKDTFFPIIKPGFWIPQVTEIGGLEELKVIKYSGDRHKISVDDSESSLTVTINTDTESHLIIYLVDPEGNIRRPTYPHWNGGEIKPIHQWNGGHWEHDEDEFRHFIIEPHTEYSVEVNNPTQGTWTAIVVPYLNMDTWEASFSGNYHITASLKKHSQDRISAGLSAANAAVIASQEHAPLLYVTEDEVPSDTTNALNQLGVNNIIFVNINEVSSATPSGSVTEYNTLQQVINAIKDHPSSENYITITSFATGDGYFAPSAMLAASHGGPVLNMGEAIDAYNANDVYVTWREYDGDYYHGCRSLGALPMLDEPTDLTNPPSLLSLILYFFQNDQLLPPAGLDYKLQLATTLHDGIYNMINGYGLDQIGPEAYCFVSPRDTDIRDSISRIMTGNNSYAGQIPVETTAFSSAMICRNILYPAIIFANPGKDVVSSQHMNYFTGQYEHDANDGNGYYTNAPRDNKNSFSSHGRFYEGHAMWENLLARYNEGSSLNYYSGHGTGGSGISSQYKNVAEQFPAAELRHEWLHDFEWWDSWAGYSGYDDSRTQSVRAFDMSIYNAEEPSLYDIIHFKWVDQLFENLHSEIDIWSSCTTAEHFGPIVYLSHGTVLYAGCTGSGYVLVDDLFKSWINRDFLIKGMKLGEAFSENTWKVNRDYTTMDPTTIYGEGTFFADGIHSVNVIFGDPNLQIVNPYWIEPVPISS